MKLSRKEKRLLETIIEDFIVENRDGYVIINGEEFSCFKRNKIAKLLTYKFIHLYDQIEKVGLI